MNTAATATTIADPQATALRNVDLLMHLEGKYRKDLAVYLGRIPQVMSRMMKSGSTWSFNDMYRTAEFLGVPLEVLTDPTLSPDRALSIIGERRNDNDGNGGLPVVGIITQRSMVQIHAPLPIETGNLLVSGFLFF